MYGMIHVKTRFFRTSPYRASLLKMPPDSSAESL